MTKKNNKTIVNSGHYVILGTDKADNGEESFGSEYFDYRKKWQEYPQKRILAEFPLHLDIESTNACNLRCPMCGRNWMKEKIGYIDWNLFKKIMDETGKYRLSSVKFNYRGEPLLHPNIVKMVRYAKEKGVLEVQFNTNGFFLDKKKGEELINAGLDRIIFSFDGATKKTYEEIRKGSDYDRVVNNIKNLVNLRDKKGLKRPLVRVQMVKMPGNKNEVEDFVKMWLPVANRIGLNVAMDMTGKEGENADHFCCHQIWQRLMICWNGEVRMCCGDWYGKIVLGDARKTSIFDLWHGKKINEIRKLHAEGNFDKIPVCASCNVNIPKIDFELKKIVEKYG